MTEEKVAGLKENHGNAVNRSDPLITTSLGEIKIANLSFKLLPLNLIKPSWIRRPVPHRMLNVLMS
jgi:hypothetical protein